MSAHADGSPPTAPPPPSAYPEEPASGSAGAVDPEARPAPDLSKRAVAALIDAAVGFVLGLVPVLGGFAAAAYWLVRDGLDVEVMDRRSLGKRVMGLRPVRLDGAPMDVATSARRNWMFAIGGAVSVLAFIPIVGWLLMVPVALVALALSLYEIYKVLTDDEGRRWGDRQAGTKVVEAAG